MTAKDRRRLTGGWHGKADHSVPGCRPAIGGGDRCRTVCRRKHRRQILRGHPAVSTSARRPGGRIDRGRATGLPVAPIRLRHRERTDGPRTPTDLRENPRARNDVQDADESLAYWTRHRIGVRRRHRRRITGAPARFACPFLEPSTISGEAQVAAHRRRSPRSSDPPSRHPLRPTDFVPQPPPCSLSVYQPSRRPRRRVLTQRFQWHLSMKRSSRRGGRAASQSRPSPAHRKEPYPTSLGDPKPNPTKSWGTSSTFMWRIVGL